jgi:DNA modification methylase
MTAYYEHDGVTLWQGDCRTILGTLPDESVQCVVTSPPYFGLRDYGAAGQIGLEQTPAAYVAEMVAVFREVRRVLREDGTLWLNLGDSYAGSGKGGDGSYADERPGWSLTPGKRMVRGSGRWGGGDTPVHDLAAKQLIGIPWRVAFALQEDGWYLRSDIIWHKPNPMPESVTDRPTRSHEYIFLLTKSARYYYDAAAIAEPLSVPLHAPGNRFDKAMVAGPNDRGGHSQWERDMTQTWGSASGRNKRDVWTVATQPYAAAHFATFPPKLIEPCILAGAPAGGVVLDPFAGAGTTLLVAKKHGRQSIGIELNAAYCRLIVDRLGQGVLPLAAAV